MGMPPKTFGRGEARTRVVGLSSRRRGESRSLLTEPCSAGNEKTWATPLAKRSPEDHAVVYTPAVATALATVSEVGDRSALSWCPSKECASQVRSDTISSRGALPDPIDDGQRFYRLQVHHPHRCQAGGLQSGHDNMFLRRIVDKSDAFPS